MPVTIIEEKDRSTRLMRVYCHDCSLGEFQHHLVLKIEAIFLAWAKEKKERVNWHDLFHAALGELESEGIIKCGVPFQNIGTDNLLSPGFIQAVRAYNADPQSFNLTKMVPEKLDKETLKEAEAKTKRLREEAEAELKRQAEEGH